MFTLGLKLWSINEQYDAEVISLYRDGVYSYIELFATPDSYAIHQKRWTSLHTEQGIPFIVHAAHSFVGLNLAKRELAERNKALAKEAFLFADALQAPHVIFHPGMDGSDSETITQIQRWHDPRILIENKPYRPIMKKGLENSICNGYSAESIARICAETRTSFCLDIGHAICAANSLKKDPREYLRSFLTLHPTMYHLSDGSFTSELDQHKNLGEGDYPLKDICALIPEGSKITIETDKQDPTSLKDFLKDTVYIRKIA